MEFGIIYEGGDSGITVLLTASAVLDSGGIGGLWRLVVDTFGNLGTESDPGPATLPAPVIDDGVGGFWEIIVDDLGNRGTQAHAGPATATIILSDGFGGTWQVIVDNIGNLGTVLI